MIEGEFGAELEAGGAVVPHAFVMQQRSRHVALVQGEGAGERGGVLDVIGPELVGYEASEQRLIDQQLIDLDGTPDKSRLGANAILGVSWFWFVGTVLTAQLPTYAEVYLGGVVNDTTLYIFALALFSVGVGVGSLLCEKLSARTVEIGLVPLGAFGIAIVTVILPSLSRQHAGEDPKAFSATLDWALRMVLLVGGDAEFKHTSRSMYIDHNRVRMSTYDAPSLVALRVLRAQLKDILQTSYRSPGRPWTPTQYRTMQLVFRTLGVSS